VGKIESAEVRMLASLKEARSQEPGSFTPYLRSFTLSYFSACCKGYVILG